jgi:signal transduction histidine kinase
LHTICRIRRKSGEWRWVQIAGKFEAGATGEPARLIGVVADITTRKRLEARAERLAERLVTIQAEERRTIAQELHDSAAQHLVAASLSLMRLRPANPLENEEEKPWNELERSLGEAIKELRNFAYLLHPPTLRSQRLRLSLQQYVNDFANRSGLVIKLRSDGKVDKLPMRVQRTIFGIVQEAMATIYRQASASVALIELRWIGPRMHVIVTDDGRGLQRRPAHRPGAGMRGIGMRLKLMGGRLKISRITPSGTRIHASVPVGAGCRKLKAAAAGDEQGR